MCRALSGMSGCRICRGLSGFVRGCVAYCVYDCVVSPRNLQGMFSTPLGRVGFPRGQVTHSTEIVHAIQPTGYTESASKVASNTTVCCKGYKLPIDNNGELFRWTSNCQLISKVYLHKSTTQPWYTLNTADRNMVQSTVSAHS